MVSEAPEFVLGRTNKTPQFLDNFPLGKVPAYCTADGNTIYESNAIAYYGKYQYFILCSVTSDSKSAQAFFFTERNCFAITLHTYTHRCNLKLVDISRILAVIFYCVVANAQLRGTNDLDTAHVLQYVNMADNEILPSVCTWTFPTLGIMQYNKGVSSALLNRNRQSHNTTQEMSRRVTRLMQIR